MIDSITVTRRDLFKGACRIACRVSTTVPVKLEDIMEPATYVLASGWADLGPTNEDGVSFTRTAELSDGIVVDQRLTALDEGEPDSWSASASCTLMHTTYGNLIKALEYGTATALGATGGRIAQHQVSIDAPASFTERQFAFIQEDYKNSRVRAWWWRKVVPAVDTEMAIKGSEATGLPFKMTINQDTDVLAGAGQFGLYFEED
jgi:hypothetical protein